MEFKNVNIMNEASNDSLYEDIDDNSYPIIALKLKDVKKTKMKVN